jgi:hypothetical protein
VEQLLAAGAAVDAAEKVYEFLQNLMALQRYAEVIWSL